MTNILALIPARSGSKGIEHKNIANFNGKPLIAHSIEQAKNSNFITRTIVSTDSELYAEIARQYGAETPFIRPFEIAKDFSTDLEVFQHALKWLAENEGYSPDICVHLRPTYPTRKVEDLDRAVSLLLSDPSFTSVRSIVSAPDSPFKMWFMSNDGSLTPVIKSSLHEPYNLARQALPLTYLQNACVDVVWSKVILAGSMTGNRIRGMLMDTLYDIDDATQFITALNSCEGKICGRRIVFDIDGVIATLTPNNEYHKAQPIKDTINVINCLYENGNTIILCTARGSLTGIDWREKTKQQMTDWGVKYHQIIFGKPAGDMYIDDRLVSIEFLKKTLK